MPGPVGLTPFVSDPDFTLYVGDVRDVLATFADGSVDCCVTSPPYWGLRDYGTGTWDGGDPGCDHAKPTTNMNAGFNERWGQGAGQRKQETKSDGQYSQRCEKCGAVRTDSQIGLEETPDAYVEALVAVFREVRRVLADHGTLWLNLGDSYAAARSYQVTDNKHTDVGNTMAASVPAGLKAKDLVGIPWRVAFALQADGWYLRSDIIWSKPNPMPESITDRPTKAHEYVFLLAKSARYFFDQEAVREPHQPDGRKATLIASNGAGITTHENYEGRQGGERWPNSGRNIRSVWSIATESYAEAHFATFPKALPERCIKAGCPERVCGTCGKARERIVKITPTETKTRQDHPSSVVRHGAPLGFAGGVPKSDHETTGWSDCGHDNWRTGTVLDPFMGSGTTALVAREQGRHAIGVELNAEYAELCARRLQQLSLLAEEPA